jgi:hypothetical protein
MPPHASGPRSGSFGWRQARPNCPRSPPGRDRGRSGGARRGPNAPTRLRAAIGVVRVAPGEAKLPPHASGPRSGSFGRRQARPTCDSAPPPPSRLERRKVQKPAIPTAAGLALRGEASLAPSRTGPARPGSARRTGCPGGASTSAPQPLPAPPAHLLVSSRASRLPRPNGERTSGMHLFALHPRRTDPRPPVAARSWDGAGGEGCPCEAGEGRRIPSFVHVNLYRLCHGLQDREILVFRLRSVRG